MKLALVFVLGCSPSLETGEVLPPAGSCPPPDRSHGCEPAPTYAADVAPILAAACTRCHAPGGAAEGDDLTTAAGVHRKGSTVLTQVQSCLMPPAAAERPLTAAERDTLVRWFACGAPDQ